ncbi:hypothetical protein VCEM1676A_001072B, partial [Vibrio cholerae O1 str. EM-1676A]
TVFTDVLQNRFHTTWA